MLKYVCISLPVIAYVRFGFLVGVEGKKRKKKYYLQFTGMKMQRTHSLASSLQHFISDSLW